MNLDPHWHAPLPKHLPRPSYAPALLAAGLMVTFWGAVTHWIVSALGLIIVGAGAWRWILDLFEEDR
jgi:hypothetical protein